LPQARQLRAITVDRAAQLDPVAAELPGLDAEELGDPQWSRGQAAVGRRKAA